MNFASSSHRLRIVFDCLLLLLLRLLLHCLYNRTRDTRVFRNSGWCRWEHTHLTEEPLDFIRRLRPDRHPVLHAFPISSDLLSVILTRNRVVSPNVLDELAITWCPRVSYNNAVKREVLAPKSLQTDPYYHLLELL